MSNDAPRPEPFGPEERRVLLLAPTRRDSEAIGVVCSSQSIETLVCASIEEVCNVLATGAGALVLAEEPLAAEPESLLACLASQPVWSDLPIIVLSRAGSESPKLMDLLARLGNISVVERPVRISTFLSTIKVALRGRCHQYEVRDHLEQLRLLESERTALWESERSARAEAERAGRMKDEFLATLSHEIRTPLNAILGWTHILADGEASGDDLAKGLEVIERNARAQAQIVSDLLDMNRIINGKVRLEPRRVELAGIVHAAVETITPTAIAKGVRISVAIDPSLGEIWGDPDRLQQVFWNLLSNAVKYTTRDQQVHVFAARSPSHLEIRVTDTGEGIDPEFLPHVFDRFRQADGSSTRRHGGLGLGLAIVKQLVELHGGSVSASSEGPGRGSTFLVLFPTDSHPMPQSSEPQQHHGSTDGPAPPSTHGSIGPVKVLVVDDEQDSRDMVRLVLESRRALVRTAASASEAVRLVQDWRPDIVISDIGMPDEDGYSLIRRVRALSPEHGGRTAAIALTAYARAEDRANALRAGFQFHIPKPVEPDTLIDVVVRAVGHGTSRR